LANAVSNLEHERSIHRNLCCVSVSGAGEPGIAQALHRLTGLPAVIEDRYGNLRAWAGPGQPDPYPKPRPEQRQEFLRRLTRRGSVMRVKDRLVALARTRDDAMLGVLALVDAGRTGGPHEVLALEHGAVVLACELARQHDLAELERRLRGDLVRDLLIGGGGDGAVVRSRAIDHDLHGPHHVVVIRWDGGTDGVLVRAAEHATASLGLPSLVSTWDGVTVVLAKGRPDGRHLHDAVARRLRTGAGSIGVGGRCDCPEELPRSFQEAMLALDIRLASRAPHGATSFDELGVIRVLDIGAGGDKVRRFVRDWLGPLLDYDAHNRAQLVRTLAEHLDCGGSYDDTASALVIHRSTLRYRLRRIREISGLDLSDANNRLNLHMATRAWRILDGRP
jgi:sugar diacid utilization regulator